MTFDKFLEHFPDTEVTDEQAACCRYLERQGKQRFMIDFGYQTAPAIVWREFDDELWEREQRVMALMIALEHGKSYYC